MADLLAIRYPALAAAREAWRCNPEVGALETLPGDGAVRLSLSDTGNVDVIACEPRLTALVGRPIAEAGVATLGKGVLTELQIALQSGRELLIEDTLGLAAGMARVAKLYLPVGLGDYEAVLVVSMLGPADPRA